MASFFLTREGNFSVFKIGVAAAVAGGLLIVGGLILAQLEEGGYRVPLDVPPPPSAIEIGIEELSPVSRRIYYEADLLPDEVARYYDAQLAAFVNTDVASRDRDRCVRTPRTGDYDNYRPGNGIVPYEYRCLFQQVSLSGGSDRVTQVVIQPGVRNDETGMDNEGKTRVEYEQYWQP